MATVPLSGTNIRLMSGIPFANDYKHTRWFDSLSEQVNWFFAQTLVYNINQNNFHRTDDKTVIAVNQSIDQLYGVNYVMFQNTAYNNKWFFAFVTELEYVNRGNTYVHIQLDILQTWRFEMNFKPSFVVREHCQQYNADGTPIVNTIDEGLNYGTEYDIVQVDQCKPYSDLYFLVIVSKSAMHDSNKIEPTLNGLPQPLNYYIYPFRLDGSNPNIMVGGLGLNSSTVINVLTAIMTQSNAVTDVVSLYVTEYIGSNASYDGSLITFNGSKFENVSIGTVNLVHAKTLPSYEPVTKTFTNKYANYRSVKESKLLMYPYTVLTLDDFKGNRVQLKNEYITSNDINIYIKGSLGTSNKVSYSVDDYLQDVNGTYAYVTGQEHAVINNNPNDIPILNDMLAAFLQGHRNTIANQKASINFNGIMNMMQSFVGAGNAVAQGVASGNELSAVMGGTQQVLAGVQGAGNSVLALQGIQAKQKDIANVPPSMSSMGSNSNFDYGNYISGMYLVRKQIKPEYQKKLEDFFNAYGYKKNEIKYPNFHTRQNWNYVQTESCVILGNFNNTDLQELKNVFDNGITLWHTDDVGNYALANGVIANG